MANKMRMIPIAACESCPNKVWDFDNYACKAFADKAITERGSCKLDPKYMPSWCPLPVVPTED